MSKLMSVKELHVKMAEAEGAKASAALKAHEAGTLFARGLGRPVASLRAESHRIIDAMDAVVSGV